MTFKVVPLSLLWPLRRDTPQGQATEARRTDGWMHGGTSEE